MRSARLAFLLFTSLLLAAAARAQSVAWVTTDDPQELTLVFTNCSPDGDPQLPNVPGVQLGFAGSSESSQFSFGTGGRGATSTVTLHYRVRARAGTPISIPAFSVKTDQGAKTVAALTLGAAARSGTVAGDYLAASRLGPPEFTVWAGEVFPLNYTLDVARRVFTGNVSNPDWDASPLVAEEWSKPDPSEVNVNGEQRAYVLYKTRAFAKAPGALDLDSVRQAVGLVTGSIGFGFLSTPQVTQKNLESNRPHVTVRALPPAPAGFSGAVGQFKLASKVVPEKAAVGEPVTWTLELSGTGNWPDVTGLPTRDVSTDFQVVQPKAKRTTAEGKLFDATLAEDVVLVPTKAGTYALGPVSFVYFDAKAGIYRTLTAERKTLTIGAPDAPKLNLNVTAPAPAETAPPEAAAKNSAPPAIPAPPAGIPRDPLPGAERARAPLASSTLLALVLAPFALPLALWAWLAVRRAQRTDPVRPRREARARLAATLAQLRPDAPSPQLLLAWQRDTAALWQIAHAAPPASALADAAWAQLWLECDRALYGAKPDLPSDWHARAEAALAAKRVPGFNPLRAFLPRNIFPFAALVVLSLVSFTALRAADSSASAPANGDAGRSAYLSGDFARAEKIWRNALATAPTDWSARHNLSLALAQQDHAGEAAAQAAAAFVENPAHSAVRWHLALASEKAGFAPAPLAAFLAPGPVPAFAQHASPAEWQTALVAAAFACALAVAGLIANAYGRRSRAAAATAGTVLALAVVSAALAVVGWQSYGDAADARAVVVWRPTTLRSIPTEADTTQKTTALPAGSVAVADKTFISDRWTRLVFENGQTGWVRNDDLVALWR